MTIKILKDKFQLGANAGRTAASIIRDTIARNGAANIILATGQSQFETLEQLVAEKDIDWGRVRMFHLDEYIGLPESHKASFRKYLRERFLEKVPPLLKAHLIDGEAPDPSEECRRLGEIIAKYPIDLAFVGIGENGHLAFNDPPADFWTVEPYLVVELNEASRRQQLGEGWFGSIGEVPRRAISMSVRQIMKSARIICACPDQRKAQAVKYCAAGPVTNLYPASILQRHPECTLYLDEASASLLNRVNE